MSKSFLGKAAHKRGFTLIELLVVIAIIGILSSVVLASLNSARTKARDAKRVSDIKQIQVALELYYDATGAYPSAATSAAALDKLKGSAGGASLSQVPLDPSDNSYYAYAYTSASNPTSYYLGANLEQAAGQTTLLNSDLDDDHSAYTYGFKGADAGKCDATNSAGGYCYAVSN